MNRLSEKNIKRKVALILALIMIMTMAFGFEMSYAEETSETSINVQIIDGANGTLTYKVNNNTEWITANDQTVISGLRNGDKVILKAKAKSGYTVDSVRSVTFRSYDNGKQIVDTPKDVVKAIMSDNGYSYTVSIPNGEANYNISLELGFIKKSNDPGNNTEPQDGDGEYSEFVFGVSSSFEKGSIRYKINACKSWTTVEKNNTKIRVNKGDTITIQITPNSGWGIDDGDKKYPPVFICKGITDPDKKEIDIKDAKKGFIYVVPENGEEYYLNFGFGPAAYILYKPSVSKTSTTILGVKATIIKAEVEATDEGIQLNWEKAGAYKLDSYKVYRATSKNGTFKRIGSTTKTTYTDKTAQTGTKYYYKIRGQRKLNDKTYYTQYSSVVTLN